MKIAVPTNPIFRPLLAKVDEVCEQMKWALTKATQDECASLLLNHFVDLALISPLGYGRGVGKVDYRIIPDPCIALVDYTAVAGISFNDGAVEIHKMGSSAPKEFLPIIGSLMLREKFEAAGDMIVQTSDINAVDCLIREYEDSAESVSAVAALDIGEEWFDLMELPLPIGVWVCRVEAELDEVSSSVKAMTAASLQDMTVHEFVPVEADHFPRNGTITFKWTDEIEQGFDAVLKLLYYYQILPEIPAVKLLDRD